MEPGRSSMKQEEGPDLTEDEGLSEAAFLTVQRWTE